MRYTGFINEHNNIKEAIPFAEMIGTDQLEVEILRKITEYLDGGILVLAWMGYFTDLETKKLIAPDSYFTDGVWVWPSYLSYYLKKYPNLKIDKSFLDYISSKQFKIEIDDRLLNKSLIERELSDKLSELLT